MQPDVQTMVDSRKVSLASQLARILLPGSLAERAQAAAGMPSWIALLLGLACFLLSVELIAYVYSVAQGFLRVIYDQWEQAFLIPSKAPWVFLEVAAMQARAHVLPALLENTGSMTISLSALIFIAGVVESLNLVVLVPFAARYNQPLAQVSHQTRRVLFSLGGLWLFEWAALWALLFLASGTTGLYFARALRIRISYTTLDDMLRLGFSAVLLLVLLAWLVRLVRTASYLPAAPDSPLPLRCGRCGYLLQGLPKDSACPDCGQPSPAASDEGRQPSPWLNRRHLGRLSTLARVSSDVLRRPQSFFTRLQVLCPHREALRFVRWNLWLCVAAWLLAVPGITSEMIDPDDVFIVNKILSASFITVVIALAWALCGALLLGLLISLMGFAISRERNEPSWPIAAEAGCYLAAWLSRIAAAQALWVTLLFTIEQLLRRGMFLRLSRQAWIHTGIPWEIVLSLTFGLPMLLGLLLLVRATVICYRNVRYACR